MSSNSLVRRTLGALGSAYYVRNFIFAAALFYLPLMLLVWSHTTQSKPGAAKTGVVITAMYALATFLYPYSRFLYERVVGFLVGENIFAIPALIYVPVKVMTMLVCYGLSFFVAPIALMYLYFRGGTRDA